MYKQKIGMYLTDNYIYICTKKNIISKKIKKKIIINNKIAKPNDFFQILIEIMKDNKIYDSFSMKTLYFIQQPHYLQSDLDLISSILEKAFNKIMYMKYSDLLNKKNIQSFNEHNAIIFLDNNYQFIDYNKIITCEIIIKSLKLLSLILKGIFYSHLFFLFRNQ